MSVLRKKLFRDLRQLGGPIVTISLVVACGVAAYVTMQGTWHSLLSARDDYYSRQRFADVFARAHRVPNAVEPQLRDIPGVARVYTRVVRSVRVPMPDLDTPATGHVVSVPAERAAAGAASGVAERALAGEIPLMGVRIVEGRQIAPGHTDEVLLLDTFARAHGVRPGDRIELVLEGRLRRFRVAGLAMSPEFVFAMPPGELFAPDDRRFAVVWMSRAAMGPAFDMEGAFNDVLATLQPGAGEASVLAELDRILAPYGGTGAHGRDRQPSHYFLSQELGQLEGLATVAPILFLAVAAFLLNVVLSRLVQLQRGQIATLKAVGYSNRVVGGHYLELVSVIVLLGVVLGLALGAFLGRGMAELYVSFFRLPDLAFRMPLRVALIAVGISLASGFVGALFTVRAVMRLPPAEAMRPPAPTLYKGGKPASLGARVSQALLGPSARMVQREVVRRPLRLVLSVLGVALAVGILVTGRSFTDAMDYLVDVYLPSTQREDLTVTFQRPVTPREVRGLEAIPGVLHAEGLRALPARLRAEHLDREVVMFGYPSDLRLRTLRDSEGRAAVLPERGALLTHTLAEVLGVVPGDELTLEPLEGDRRPRRILVAATIDEMFGVQAHLRIDELHRVLGEAPSMNTAMLAIDEAHTSDVLERLREYPSIASVSRRDVSMAQFREQSAESTRVTALVLTLFAITIAIGVVYNNARISLSMRSRDLASLRVLGFTRAEIAEILFLELSVQVLLAIPLGWYFGYRMMAAMMGTADQEAYRLPAMVSLPTYAFATAVTLIAAFASALLIRRKLDRLDLIGVLKTRE